MTTESIIDQIEQEAGKSLLKNAIFRLESALMVGGAILASVFMPNIISWLPWWAWSLLRPPRPQRPISSRRQNRGSACPFAQPDSTGTAANPMALRVG